MRQADAEITNHCTKITPGDGLDVGCFHTATETEAVW